MSVLTGHDLSGYQLTNDPWRHWDIIERHSIFGDTLALCIYRDGLSEVTEGFAEFS